MNEQTSMKDDFAKALVDAPGHAIRYVGGMIIALLGDYTLITLLIFVTLLGFAVSSWLIAATAFFGLYFLLRLVASLTDVIGYHANTTAQTAANVGRARAQSTMQVAAALAQFHPPQEQSEAEETPGTVA